PAKRIRLDNPKRRDSCINQTTVRTATRGRRQRRNRSRPGAAPKGPGQDSHFRYTFRPCGDRNRSIRYQRRGRQPGIFCMHPKTIGIIAHTGKPGVGDLVNAITQEFSRFSITALLEKETARIAGKKSEYSIVELGAATDLLVVAGGDGTILRAVGQLGEAIKPIFGINVGSLVFLTTASSANYREAVECLAKDRINFSQPALLDARVRLAEKQTANRLALN